MPNLPHITRFRLPGIDRRLGGSFRHTHLCALEPLHAGWQVFAAPQFRASESSSVTSIGTAISRGDANRDRSVGESLMVIELVQRVQDTHVFSRIAAIELRRLAGEDPDPDTAAELRYVAQLFLNISAYQPLRPGLKASSAKSHRPSCGEPATPIANPSIWRSQ